MKILFLCRGNVGRSIFAEHLYNKMTGTKNAISAGTKPSRPEQSLESALPKSQFVIECLKQEGVYDNQTIRRRVTPEMAGEANLIIDMAEPETIPDFVKDHPNRIVWTVDDPKGTDLKTHLKVKDEIKEKIQKELL